VSLTRCPDCGVPVSTRFLAFHVCQRKPSKKATVKAPKLSEMIPRNKRERELADFWYNKGCAETRVSGAITLRDKKRVEIKVVDGLPKRRRLGRLR
jgi:hypothetical protein